MPSYDTLVEALNGLKARGFTTDFNIRFNTIQCNSTGKTLSTSEFEIVEHHRFEGDSNPSDESVVYAIASKDGSLKGVLVSAYGAYSESMGEELIKKLSIHE